MKPLMRTKILVDGGDPTETLRVKNLIGDVDGQTTNPTLIARNPEIRELISSGQKLSRERELDEYRKIVRQIAPLVGNAGVSIEVFADFDTTAEDMLAQGREMFSWIPNAYIKISMHKRGLGRGSGLGAPGHSGQHDPVLFARAGRCRLRRDERLKTASLRFSFPRQAR